jgi:hypothetical protein
MVPLSILLNSVCITLFIVDLEGAKELVDAIRKDVMYRKEFASASDQLTNQLQLKTCFQKKGFSVYLPSLWPILIVFNRIDRKRKEFEGIFKK